MLAREQVLASRRLSRRRPGPALLDLLQVRPLHHHHLGSAARAAADDGEDVVVGHRQPADTSRTVRLRLSGSRKDAHHQRDEVPLASYLIAFDFEHNFFPYAALRVKLVCLQRHVTSTFGHLIWDLGILSCVGTEQAPLNLDKKSVGTLK